MKSRIANLWYQFYNLFLIPNRWDEYRYILTRAQQADYNFIRLDQFSKLLSDNAEIPQPFLILRHDIDTDAHSALKFCSIERELGIKATYFFRLRTWDNDIVKAIVDAGHEVGYHFEELAIFAKQKHLKKPHKVIIHKHQMLELLDSNLQALRTYYPINSLASHGDFANRVLGIMNHTLTDDIDWRRKMGIEYEAYDEKITSAYNNHVSDSPYPVRFKGAHPLSMIASRKSFLFLTHPRWWHRNVFANLTELSIRVKDQILW